GRGESVLRRPQDVSGLRAVARLLGAGADPVGARQAPRGARAAAPSATARRRGV
ncbi:MAG: hypothetical protein AVDCRST_MAG08-3933, partial [uncultured Acetobacteraceae bacterium]